MRIGLISDCYYPTMNGVSGLVGLLAAGLEARGHHVVLVAPRGPRRPAWHSEPEKFDDQGCRPADVQRRSLPVWPSVGVRFAPASTRGMARIVRSEGLEVVHTHTEGPLGRAARNSAIAAGIPLIHTLHTFYRHYLHYLPATALARGFSARRLERAMGRFLAPYDRVVAPSAGAEREITGFAPHVRTALIPNGVSGGVEASAATRVAEMDLRSPYLLYVGRIAREKRSRELFEALCLQLSDRSDLRAVLVGGGGSLTALRRSAVRRGLEDRIHLPGYLPRRDVRALYDHASVFVTASLSENHPLTWLEAAAAGLPVAVRRDPNLAELVIDGVTGIVTDDDRTLVVRAVALADDPARRARLGAAARHLSRRFSAAAHLDRTERLYLGLLDR